MALPQHAQRASRTTGRFSRASLLRRGAAGGGALLVSASGGAVFVRASAAAGVPDGDLAYLRVLLAAELLAADCQRRALASGRLAPSTARLVRSMLADEKAHATALSSLIAGAGQVAATAADIDFTYPAGAFARQASILELAGSLERLTLGAYLGAIENVQTPSLRLPIGQIAANEAQHVSVLAAASGRPPIGRAFAPSLQIEAVSAALDAYES